MTNLGFPDWQEFNVGQGQPFIDLVSFPSTSPVPAGPYFVGMYPALQFRFIPSGTALAYQVSFAWYADEALTKVVGTAVYSIAAGSQIRDQLQNCGPWLTIFITPVGAIPAALYDFRVWPRSGMDHKGKMDVQNAPLDLRNVGLASGVTHTIGPTVVHIGVVDWQVQATTPFWSATLNALDSTGATHFVAGMDGMGLDKSKSCRISLPGNTISHNVTNLADSNQQFSFSMHLVI